MREYDPTSSETSVLVATYRRTIRASLERIWENVRDWEHLPWLHRRAFVDIDLIEQTTDCWRAWVTLAPREASRRALIELSLEPAHLRYWSRVRDGQRAGSEILTCLEPLSERITQIQVEFRVPKLAPERIETVGEAYLALYTRLWDEDERMMIRRQALLNANWANWANWKERSKSSARQTSLINPPGVV